MSKAELKTQIRTTLDSVGASIAASLASIAQIDRERDLAVGVFEVRIGMALANARDAFAEAKANGVDMSKVPNVKTNDWREYARNAVPGKSPATLYRWQNAGVVARILGDSVGNALVGSLVPLYRILPGAKATEEERTAAEGLIRETYAECVTDAGTDDNGRPIPPEESAVLAAAERVSPSTRSGGGSKGGGGSKSTDEETPASEETPAASGTVSVVELETAKLETAAGPVASIRQDLSRKMVGKSLTDEGLLSIMLATLRLAGEHGPAIVTAVLSGVTTAPETADNERAAA
jgi:hypothetical protein